MQIVSSKIFRAVLGLLVLATGILSIIASGGDQVYISPAPRAVQVARIRQHCQSLLESTDIGSRPKNYRSLITSHMKEVLKDPSSAQYSWDKADGPNKGFGAYVIPEDCHVGWAVCVSINAKNSYGAYAGAERWLFIIRDNTVTYSVKASPEENTSGCL